MIRIQFSSNVLQSPKRYLNACNTLLLDLEKRGLGLQGADLFLFSGMHV